MQELCHICAKPLGYKKYEWMYQYICVRCNDLLKWDRWHRGVSHVRAVEIYSPLPTDFGSTVRSIPEEELPLG